MTFTESYKQNLDKIRFLSKLSAFLIAVILLIEVSTNLYQFISWSKLDNVNENLFKFKIAHAFLIPITIIFIVRFFLLWFKSSKFIWFSLIAWLIGWLSIFIYYLVTQQMMFGSIFASVEMHCADCIYSLLFLWASKPIAILLYLYLLLSPIHQILHLFISFFHRK